MLFLWDCNCPGILLCSVLLIQLESLVLCAFGNSTMMSIAILVLEYCKQKHGQVRGFCTILTKSNDVDKFRVIQPEHGVPALMCKNVPVSNPVHGVFIYDTVQSPGDRVPSHRRSPSQSVK